MHSTSIKEENENNDNLYDHSFDPMWRTVKPEENMNDKNKHPYAEYSKDKHFWIRFENELNLPLTIDEAARLYKSLGKALARYSESDPEKEPCYICNDNPEFQPYCSRCGSLNQKESKNEKDNS